MATETLEGPQRQRCFLGAKLVRIGGAVPWLKFVWLGPLSRAKWVAKVNSTAVRVFNFESDGQDTFPGLAAWDDWDF